QLERLDVDARLLLEASIGLLDGDRRQIAGELRGYIVGERAPGVTCRLSDRVLRAVDREQVDPERVGEARRQRVAIRLERAQEVLAQGEESPDLRVLERLAELPEELPFRLEIDRIER